MKNNYDDLNDTFNTSDDVVDVEVSNTPEAGCIRRKDTLPDITDKLADLQKKMKDLDEDKPKGPSTVTNNAVFVGSTSELQKMLKQEILNNKEE